MTLALIGLTVITAVFGVLRFILPVSGKINKQDIYKDLAHIWVGFLLGFAAAYGDDWRLWGLAIGLTMLEVIAFVVRKAKQ